MRNTCRNITLGLGAVLTGAVCVAAPARPNILLIVADDLGYSDLGCFGAEIETPRLDALAAQGVRYSNFRVNPMCVVTRTSLLTGHTYTQSDNYERSAHLARMLKQAGYLTSISGKWHQPGHPMDWGFDRFYGFLGGAIHSLSGMAGGKNVIMNGREEAPPGPDWYATDAFADHAIQSIDEALAAEKPFFSYLAYNAPHTPLSCTRDDVDKYVGRYREGWETLRARRYQRLRDMGMISSKYIMSPPAAEIRRWDELPDEDQRFEDFRMATYAGVIDHMDRSVGRVIDHLAAQGALENTLIVFMSDNGGDYGNGNIATDRMQKPWEPGSVCMMPNGWASVKCAPFRFYKNSAYEGGVRVPLIMRWPKGMAQPGGSILHQRLHATDLYPTFLELAGASYPTPDADNQLAPLYGHSMCPLFRDGSLSRLNIHDETFWSLYSTRALLQGWWKCVSINEGPWHLYHLEDDPCESYDMASQAPEQVTRMSEDWYRFAEEKTTMAPSWRTPLQSKQQGWGWYRLTRIMPITDIEPAMAAPYAPLDTDVTLTFSAPLDFNGTEGKTIGLYDVSDRTTPIWQADPGPDHPAQGQCRITFDLPDLTADTTYCILADAGWAKIDGRPIHQLNDGAYWYRFRTRIEATPYPPSERIVGIAYGLWMDEEVWADESTWGTPLLGQYDSRDRRVMRRHAEWLTDAGVDFVWIDWSNQINYDPTKPWSGGKQDLIEDATAILFDEYSKMERSPKISIFVGVTLAPDAPRDGRLQRKADQIYEMYVAKPEYRRLLQYHEGKPLLVVYVHTPSPWLHGTPEWDDDRFTVRWMTGFVTQQAPLLTQDGQRISRYGYWSWEDRGKQSYPVVDGRPEAMVITAATREHNPPSAPDHIPALGRRGGATFREQFAYAREIGPKFAMVVSWNEWLSSEQPSVEVSKDLEPTKEWGDTYLKRLKEEIAAFKAMPSK